MRLGSACPRSSKDKVSLQRTPQLHPGQAQAGWDSHHERVLCKKKYLIALGIVLSASCVSSHQLGSKKMS